MPTLDLIHHAVRAALIKDGWTITEEPYTIEFENVRLYVDMGAQRTYPPSSEIRWQMNKLRRDDVSARRLAGSSSR